MCLNLREAVFLDQLVCKPSLPSSSGLVCAVCLRACVYEADNLGEARRSENLDLITVIRVDKISELLVFIGRFAL